MIAVLAKALLQLHPIAPPIVWVLPIAEESRVAGQANDDPRFGPSAEKEAVERGRRVKQKIAELDSRHPWAGSYYSGDGLGTNKHLSLVSDEGFVFEWQGCLGVYDRNYGAVLERNGVLEFAFVFPNQSTGYGLHERLVPVSWGARRYLIPSEQFTRFANYVNSGEEPRDVMLGSFLLRVGDEKINVTGKPTVPERYSFMFLDQPLGARIVSVEEAGLDNQGRSIVAAIIDRGSENGVFEGMLFYGLHGSRFEVTELTATTAKVRMANILRNGPMPKVGMGLSTRL